ncbi:hypothetical protein Pmani_024331 [Petrolisthes manimaculis]|uniref:HTH CENPB-type domain-containing protein n=1 Tax=Petrolisthes manimaculis TaxID=1843537 RepID=A0AAE1P9I2_9EUCA|nr:hypothetical protein Pmani_024331 [Petrolisthes manimaculis]
MAGWRPRTELPLNKKIELIKRAESTNLSQRKLAEEFGIGRTQVGSILKRRRDYEDALDRNECGAKRRFVYSSANHEVNHNTWEWFIRMRAQNLSVTGPMIQQQALSYATDLGMVDFKASNGWLEAFKKRHNIGQSKSCSGENISLDSDIISEWYTKLGQLHKEYGPEDLYNMDEMCCFYRALPDRSLVLCDGSNDAQCVNLSLDKLTVLLCCNMNGKFLPPLVIVKSEKPPPSCFKNNNTTISSTNSSSLVQNNRGVVKWNKEGHLTPTLFLEWVSELDVVMRLEQRHILLFLDNALSSHTQDSANALHNVKLVFFPATHLQPLDQGIIHHIKVYYRKHLLHRVLAILDKQNSSTMSSVHNNQMTYTTSTLHSKTSSTLSSSINTNNDNHNKTDTTSILNNNHIFSTLSSSNNNNHNYNKTDTTSSHNNHISDTLGTHNSHITNTTTSIHDHNQTSGSVASLLASVSVLDALNCVSDALKDVNQAVVCHGFVCAGFPKQLLLVGGGEDDSSSSLPPPPKDPTLELESLIASVAAALSLPDPMTAQEYASLEFITPVSEMFSDVWPQDFLTAVVDKKPELYLESERHHEQNTDDSQPELQYKPNSDISRPRFQHESNNGVSSSSINVIDPTPKSEIKDVATALYWAQQLKVFAVQRAMGELESTFSQGVDILTKELGSKVE